MRSRPSARAKATPSRTARVSSGAPWLMRIPTSAPRAAGSKWGVRSPRRYGRKIRPSLPAGTFAAAASSSRLPLGSSGRSRRTTQSSEAAAERIAAMTHHWPGTTWARPWSRPSGSTCGSATGASTWPPGAERDEHGARRVLLPGHAQAKRRRRGIGSAHRHGDSGRQTEGPGGVLAQSPGLRLRFHDRRQQPGVDPQLLADVRRPRPGLQVEQERRRGVGNVARHLAGQACPQGVLGLHDPARPGDRPPARGPRPT